MHIFMVDNLLYLWYRVYVHKNINKETNMSENIDKELWDEYMNKRYFKNIEFRNLIFRELQNERYKDEFEYSVSNQGILVPVLVVGPYMVNGVEKYKVIDGVRRLSCIRKYLDYDDFLVPCYVIDDSDTSDVYITEYTHSANTNGRIGRIDVDLSYAKCLYRDYLNHCYTEEWELIDDFAACFDISEFRARKYFELLQMHNEALLEAVAHGDISLDEALDTKIKPNA